MNTEMKRLAVMSHGIMIIQYGHIASGNNSVLEMQINATFDLIRILRISEFHKLSATT
jgi:hypothetical protein